MDLSQIKKKGIFKFKEISVETKIPLLKHVSGNSEWLQFEMYVTLISRIIGPLNGAECQESFILLLQLHLLKLDKKGKLNICKFSCLETAFAQKLHQWATKRHWTRSASLVKNMNKFSSFRIRVLLLSFSACCTQAEVVFRAQEVDKGQVVKLPTPVSVIELITYFTLLGDKVHL